MKTPTTTCKKNHKVKLPSVVFDGEKSVVTNTERVDQVTGRAVIKCRVCGEEIKVNV